MNEIIRKDILKVLSSTIEAFKQQRFQDFSAISNQTIHNATIYQDEDSLAVAVLVYALGKVATRCMETGGKCPNLLPQLNALDGLLAQDRQEEYRAAMRKILDDIRAFDEKMHMYIEEVLQKARLKKGSKLHEHGISIARAAEILGISQWELMSYIGKTSVPDMHAAKEDVRTRYKRARALFG